MFTLAIQEVEVGTQPIKTKDGWIIIYSHIKNYFNERRLFAIRAVLLDLKNPLKIISRTTMPLLTPEEYYENYGLTPNVIFPSGAMLEKNILRIYYGADLYMIFASMWNIDYKFI